MEGECPQGNDCLKHFELRAENNRNYGYKDSQVNVASFFTTMVSLSQVGCRAFFFTPTGLDTGLDPVIHLSIAQSQQK